jgi:hypothetical protein
MTLHDIAIKLRRPYNTIKSFWRRRCARLVSDEDLHLVEGTGRNCWTEKEFDHLESMFRQGWRPKEISLHFPSRTTSAIYKMVDRKFHLWKYSPRGTWSFPARRSRTCKGIKKTSIFHKATSTIQQDVEDAAHKQARHEERQRARTNMGEEKTHTQRSIEASVGRA